MKPDTMNRYTIKQAVEDVAIALASNGNDSSPTTIRCAINDRLDAAERDGHTVHHGYDQGRAIRAVQKEISTIRRYQLAQ